MKVIHVSTGFFSQESMISGGGRYTQELAAAMAGMVETEVWAFGPRARTLDYSGVKVRVFPARVRREGPRGEVLRDLAAGASLVPFKAAREADVLHVHQPHTALGNSAMIAAWLSEAPCAVTDMGAVNLCLSRKVDFNRFVDAYLPISAYAAQVHAEDPEKVRVIGAGVDTKRFCPGPASRRDEVLFVGTILPHKGIDTLIDAMPPGLRLRIVGQPYSVQYLALLREKAAGKDVVFQHNVGDDELVDLYRHALVTVLSTTPIDVYGKGNTRAQLSALTVMESYACGTPAIATDIEALPEIVERGRDGILVPPREPAAMREAIERLAADRALVERMGRAAREAAEAKFTWTAVARRAVEAYGEIADPALTGRGRP